jgi:hypothetical protein
MKPVVWIAPKIRRGVTIWEHRCEAQLTTEEAIEHRRRIGMGTQCTNFAKIDYRGSLLCVKHAEKKSLQEMMSESPEPSAKLG